MSLTVRFTTSRVTDEEAAAVAAALTSLGTSSAPPRRQTPAWRAAALREQVHGERIWAPHQLRQR